MEAGRKRLSDKLRLLDTERRKSLSGLEMSKELKPAEVIDIQPSEVQIN